MDSLKSWTVVNLFLLFLLPRFSHSLDPSLSLNSSLNNSYSWYTNLSDTAYRSYDDGSAFWRILFDITYDFDTSTGLFLGFFANTSTTDGRKDIFYLVIALYPGYYSGSAVVVWCANRDRPVRENALLHLTARRGLELKDVDDTLVWSTNTSGSSVARVNLSSGGNLMLLDGKDNVIWQSFDYPTDTWLPNQNISSLKRLKGADPCAEAPAQSGVWGGVLTYAVHTLVLTRSRFRTRNLRALDKDTSPLRPRPLLSLKRLTSSNSSSNLATGLYSLAVGRYNRLDAFINSDPTQIYLSMPIAYYDHLDEYSSIEALSANYAVFKVNRNGNEFRYIRLDSTGRLYFYGDGDSYNLFANSSFRNDCDYPTACGNYGVCSGNGYCINCPGGNASYFTVSQTWHPEFGCTPVTPLSCEDRHHHSFLELKSFSYFKLGPLYSVTDRESCKRLCLDNCTCKVAFFSSGLCFLKSQVYTLKYDVKYNSVAFIKVQNQALQLKKSYLIPILASTLSIGLVIILVSSCYYRKMLINSKNNNEEDEEDPVIGALKRFSFLELKSATWDFQVKLGRGGFGSVFEGDLADGSKVAVKCLDSIGQGRKEFLAEVNTIGSINHFNLVRLIGYCAEKSNRLLVYEHMCNGSLDKWIFNPDRTQALGWEIRRKIIIGLAKGLEYLHMLCNPSIIHFDIKPQNILLDGDFNVKISDFGLAKLIDRDQSQVLTALKGTPGYVAPELFSGTNISVKADVFSFGIVILEIVLGRKNLDSTQSCPLINVVKEKAENDQLDDLVEGYNEDIQLQKEEAVKMIKIGIWCLQAHNTRPSISTILKVLEGSMDLGPVSEYCSATTPPIEAHLQANSALSTPPVASILSGPR